MLSREESLIAHTNMLLKVSATIGTTISYFLTTIVAEAERKVEVVHRLDNVMTLLLPTILLQLKMTQT